MWASVRMCTKDRGNVNVNIEWHLDYLRSSVPLAQGSEVRMGWEGGCLCGISVAKMTVSTQVRVLNPCNHSASFQSSTFGVLWCFFSFVKFAASQLAFPPTKNKNPQLKQQNNQTNCMLTRLCCCLPPPAPWY